MDITVFKQPTFKKFSFFLLVKKYVTPILEAVLSCAHFATKSALSGSSTLRVSLPG